MKSDKIRGLLAEVHHSEPRWAVWLAALALAAACSTAPRVDSVTVDAAAQERADAAAIEAREAELHVNMLVAMGYVDGDTDDLPTVPTVHVRTDAACDVPRLVVGLGAHEVFAIRPDGERVQSWRIPRLGGGMREAIPLPDGGLVVIREYRSVMRLSAESELLWETEGGYHHHASLSQDGTLWTLRREGGTPPSAEGTPRGPEHQGDELAVRLDLTTGTPIHAFSLLEALPPGLRELAPKTYDPAHANRITELPSGELLLSLRDVSTVARLDPATEAYTWWVTGSTHRQHSPVPTPDGGLLVFDNWNKRAVKLDSSGHRSEWSTPVDSSALGHVDVTPCGTYLVTDSYHGTSEEWDGDRLVWSYGHPHPLASVSAL